MESKKNLSILLIALSFTISSFNLQNGSIVGEWIEEENVISRWVFTSDNKLKMYNENVLTETFTYSISSTSPKCGRSVRVNSGERYLELVSTSDPLDILCYQLNGIDFNGSGNLSLTYLINGNTILLTKP